MPTSLRLRIDEPTPAGDGDVSSAGARAPSARPTAAWLWLVAAAAVALLAVAVVGQDGGATLHAIPASESMTDDEAHAVAEKTILAWTRERNAGNAANLDAPTCADAPRSWCQLSAVAEGKPATPFDIVATAVSTLWETSGERGLFVWKVGTGLIQRTDDEIVSLTAAT